MRLMFGIYFCSKIFEEVQELIEIFRSFVNFQEILGVFGSF
jgi:hypothetical protein